MKLTSLFLFLSISVLKAGAGIAQDYSIVGSLVSSIGGTTVARGHVTASLAMPGGRAAGPRSNSVTADADERGSFVLSLPSPGIWKLMASGKGFRARGLDEHEGYSTGIALSKAKPSSEVIFRLIPNGNIQGFVVDEAGEAVRAAQVTLLREATERGDDLRTTWQIRGSTQTNDLGNYEFADLGPGRYEVMVQARPWYASVDPQGAIAPLTPTLDSPLDVAYPLTWYPGVSDSAAAGVVSIAGGESRQADVRLRPVPSVHLRIAAAGPAEVGQTVVVPRVSLLLPENGSTLQPLQPMVGAHGEVDVGGLAPGTYEVSTQAGQNRGSILQIGAGSPRTLDLSAAVPLTEMIVRFDASEGVVAPTVRFVNTETGRVTLLGGAGSFLGSRGLSGRFGEDDASMREVPPVRERAERMRMDEDHKVELAAGRYEVRLGGSQGQYLTAISAKGAEINGFYVSVHGGVPELMLHLAAGHATLKGVGIKRGVAVRGAMVMLVPVAQDNSVSSTVIRREQTNSDGSFILSDVEPGRYILIVVQDGWDLNWKDASTLRPYLLQGAPVEIGSSGLKEEKVEVE